MSPTPKSPTPKSLTPFSLNHRCNHSASNCRLRSSFLTCVVFIKPRRSVTSRSSHNREIDGILREPLDDPPYQEVNTVRRIYPLSIPIVHCKDSSSRRLLNFDPIYPDLQIGTATIKFPMKHTTRINPGFKPSVKALDEVSISAALNPSATQTSAT